MQLIFRYGFLKFQNIFLSLADWQYGLLVLSTMLIAAAGYIINDILDQETDYDNDKGNVIIGKLISEKSKQEKWGAKVIEQMSADLQKELPGLRGFSFTNLKKGGQNEFVQQS